MATVVGRSLLKFVQTQHFEKLQEFVAKSDGVVTTIFCEKGKFVVD